MCLFRLVVVLYFLLVLATPSAKCDETHARYFEQLRQRGLFSLAESEAISRLAADDIPLAERTGFVIELSRTLAEHAGFVNDEQRNELWQRARGIVQELLDRDKANSRSVLLNGQLGSVYALEGDWLRAEHDIRPFDEILLNQARSACTKAIELLMSIEKTVAEPSRETSLKKPANGAILGYELRSLLQQTRWQLGQSYRNRAELSPFGSAERTKDLTDAEQVLRRVIGVADEPISSRAKLLLVVCQRLKGERDKASEALASLEKSDPKSVEYVRDEITAERVRQLLELKRPTESAELLLKTRGSRQRLTGELWMLQTRSLITLRTLTLEKQQETLAERIAEQIVSTIERCEEQVGGFWSRRCRQLWENNQTAQKYGVELDSLMQQARTDFVAGRIDTAIAEYAQAEKIAKDRQQLELAMELGFTRASILLDEMQFETANVEFLRLATDYSATARAPKAHLLATYCLGRLYDDKRTQARRTAYTDALEKHLKDFSQDATVNDARFMKAQYEEQRLQSSVALPLYLQIESDHPRSLDGMAGAGRCYETILRRMIDRHISTEEFDREAVKRLTSFLSRPEMTQDSWNTTTADIALRLAAILLMGSGDQVPSHGKNRLRDAESSMGVSLNLSDRCQRAERLLTQVNTFVEHKDSDAVSNESIERLRQRIAVLRIVALAGIGKFGEAEKLLTSSTAAPTEILTVLERLNLLLVSMSGTQKTQMASLELHVAERLSPHREQLLPADCARLDLFVLNANLSTGETAKAVKIAQGVADKSANDMEKQRAIAIQFGKILQSDCQTLAKQCWRRIESLTKPGTADWLTAREGVIKACISLKQIDEAQKLLQVTKVLYPEIMREPLKSQFDSLEKALQIQKASPN